MKKIISVLIILCMLCSCSNGVSVSSAQVAKAYQNGFTANVTAVFGENKTEMSITKNPMSISILLNYPAELAGMGIELFDEHAVITYQGMTQEINTDNLPDGTPFLLLEELFDELSDPEEFALSTEVDNLSAKNDDFTAVLDGENFALISAKFSGYATEFTFTEFEFTAQN